MQNAASVAEARVLVDLLPAHSAISWTALVLGYAEIGNGDEVFNCFEQTQMEVVYLDKVTFVCSLKACIMLEVFETGQFLHSHVIKRGWKSEANIGTTLLNMYAKCSLLAEAQDVFDKLSVRQVLVCNALICGFAKHGLGEEALECFQQMQLEGALPDAMTFTGILKACGSIKLIVKGREMHAAIVRQNFHQRDLVVSNALLDMYAKFEWFKVAHGVLEELPVRNSVSWNTLIAAYAKMKHGEQALFCYKLIQSEGILLDAVTLVCSLRACCNLKALSKGQEIHVDAVRKGLMNENSLVGNALVDMYAKYGLLVTTQHVFNKLSART